MSPEVLLSLTSAALGAGGAIAAQAVAEYFSGRRDRRRFDWEKDRWAEDQRLAQTARFEQAKLDAYRRYLNLLYPTVVELQDLVKRPDEARSAQFRPYDQAFKEEVDSLRWEVSLLADSRVTSAVEVANAALLVSLIQLATPKEWSDENRLSAAETALRAWQHTSHIMRADLRGDQRALESLHQDWISRDARSKPSSDSAFTKRLDDLLKKYGPKRTEPRPEDGGAGS